jgi:hypothetical protein
MMLPIKIAKKIGQICCRRETGGGEMICAAVFYRKRMEHHRGQAAQLSPRNIGGSVLYVEVAVSWRFFVRIYRMTCGFPGR